MNHPREDLTAWLDGALAPARADEVRDHVAGCPGCRAEAARLRGAIAALASLPPAPELPPFFATRLEARLREERARPPGLLARWRARLDARLPRPRTLAIAGAAALGLALAAVPVRSWLDTRAMVEDLDLLQDYETASALAVDTPEDALVVAQLEELARAEPTP